MTTLNLIFSRIKVCKSLFWLGFTSRIGDLVAIYALILSYAAAKIFLSAPGQSFLSDKYSLEQQCLRHLCLCVICVKTIGKLSLEELKLEPIKVRCLYRFRLFSFNIARLLELTVRKDDQVF